MEKLLNGILRVVFGVIAILCINDLISSSGLGITVGLNPITISTVGILGTPGVLLLYALELYYTGRLF